MAIFNGKKILMVALKGEPGVSPHVGPNGHWFIGDEDTGIFAGDRAGGPPTFDLTALGLPAIPVGGSGVYATFDTSELLAAMGLGSVFFAFDTQDENGSKSRVNAVMNIHRGANTEESYAATHVYPVGADLQLTTILVGTDMIMATSQIIKSSDIDPTLKTSGAAADAKITGDRLALLEKDMADLLYKEISVSSFTNSAGTVELGSTVNEATLTWKLNKTPVSVTIDGTAQEAVAGGSVKQTGLALKANKTWTLKATDERDAVATKTTAVSFVNGVYYGAAASGAMNSAFILSLTRTLRSNKLPSFTVNAAAGQYIYYCIPTRYGTCSFSVGGFSGGFSLAATTSFTNASGYTEEYYVYKSDNAGLGSTTVAVS